MKFILLRDTFTMTSRLKTCCWGMARTKRTTSSWSTLALPPSTKNLEDISNSNPTRRKLTTAPSSTLLETRTSGRIQEDRILRFWLTIWWVWCSPSKSEKIKLFLKFLANPVVPIVIKIVDIKNHFNLSHHFLVQFESFCVLRSEYKISFYS